ncbi:MAG: hypothetical protein AB7N65_26415 [Vicinamibacterales bacterium]
MTTAPATNDVREVEEYEAPRVEQVITAAELTREIQYAGLESEVEIPIG